MYCVPQSTIVKTGKNIAKECSSHLLFKPCFMLGTGIPFFTVNRQFQFIFAFRCEKLTSVICNLFSLSYRFAMILAIFLKKEILTKSYNLKGALWSNGISIGLQHMRYEVQIFLPSTFELKTRKKTKTKHIKPSS